jgi:hypothetical protein
MAVSKKMPVFHAHGCIQCGSRYMDSCTTSEKNGTCYPCRSGVPNTFLTQGYLPIECCPSNIRRVFDPDELLRYRLAGPGPWFICRSCQRTFPHHIEQDQTQDQE